MSRMMSLRLSPRRGPKTNPGTGRSSLARHDEPNSVARTAIRRPNDAPRRAPVMKRRQRGASSVDAPGPARFCLALAAALVALVTPATGRPSAPRVPAPMPSPNSGHEPALPGYSQVAVMPISSLGSTDEAVLAVERVLWGEFTRLLGKRLVLPAELAKRGGRLDGDVKRCDNGLDCLVDVFGAYGFGAFVVGNLIGLGADRVINLKVLDVKTGRELGRVSEKASGAERELISQMRRAAVLLLAPEQLIGTVEVHATQPEINILIDGQLYGTTPLASPRLTVTAGRHAVEANGEGRVPFSAMIDVAYGEVVSLTIDLPANTVFVGGRAPYRSRWWTWATAVVGAACLGTSGVFYYQHTRTAAQISDAATAGTLDARQVGLRAQWQNRLTLARGFGGVGVGLSGAVGVLLTLDWL